MFAPNAFATDFAQPLLLTAEQQAIVNSTASSLIVEALAGTGKTTTLACRAVQVLRQNPNAKVLVLTYSKAGVLAFEQRLHKLVQQVPGHLRVTTVERWAAQVMRQRDPQLQFVVDPLILREQAKRAMEILSAQQERQPDPALHMDYELDLQDFWQFNHMAKKSLLRSKWEDAGCSLAEFCEDLQLDYRLARLFMNYESLRSNHCGDIQYCAEGDCTYALATDSEHQEFAFPSYDVVLMDEMHDLDEAALQVLRRLLQTSGAQFMGAGDFNQHIDAQALSVFKGQLQHLSDALPQATVRLPLTLTRRFGAQVAQAVNDWFGVGMQAHRLRHSHVDRLRYQDDADCITQLLQAQQKIPQGTDDTTAAALPRPTLHVILRHPHEACALEWTLYRQGRSVSLQGLQHFYLGREVALLLGLLYAHSTQALDWKADAPCLLSTDILEAFVDGALYYGKGQHFAQAPAPSEEDDPDADFSPVHHFQQALQTRREAHQHTQKEMARQMHGHPLAIWNFLMDKAHLQGGSRNFAAFGRFLQLPQHEQANAAQLLQAADVWALFDSTPMPHDEAQRVRYVVEHFLHAIEGMSVAQVLADIAGMAQRGRKVQWQRKRYDFQLLTIEQAKGQEFDYVALPFLQPGRFPAPAPHDRAFLERNRLYVAMTRVRKRLWLLEHAQHPVLPFAAQ